MSRTRTLSRSQMNYIQQMIDASFAAEVARTDYDALATEGYVDDCIRVRWALTTKANYSVVNDLHDLEHEVNKLRRGGFEEGDE